MEEHIDQEVEEQIDPVTEPMEEHIEEQIDQVTEAELDDFNLADYMDSR